MNRADHLDAQRVYDLLDGRLAPAAESRAQAHLFRCDRCRQLERECAGVVEALHWYGAEKLAPPAGYWEAFWARWSPSEEPLVLLRFGCHTPEAKDESLPARLNIKGGPMPGHHPDNKQVELIYKEGEYFE